MMAADELARAAEIFRALSDRPPPPWSVGFLVELPGGAGSVLLGLNTSICGQIFAVSARWPALRLTIRSGGA